MHKIRPTCFQSILSTLCSMTSIGYRLFLMRLTENKMRQMGDTGYKCFVCQVVAGTIFHAKWLNLIGRQFISCHFWVSLASFLVKPTTVSNIQKKTFESNFMYNPVHAIEIQGNLRGWLSMYL